MSLVDVYDDYREVAKDDLPRMREDVFHQNILPELVRKNRGEKVNYDYWASITGNPHREILVYDTDGQELFRVPPILSRLPTDITPDAFIGIAGLSDLYAKRRTVENPVAVDLWFNQTVAKMSPAIHDEDMLRYLRNNMLIYTRYNIDHRELLGEAAGTIMAKPPEGTVASDAAAAAVADSKPVADASDYDFDEDSQVDL